MKLPKVKSPRTMVAKHAGLLQVQHIDRSQGKDNLCFKWATPNITRKFGLEPDLAYNIEQVFKSTFRKSLGCQNREIEYKGLPG